MLGEKVKLQHLKRNEIMPYYFDESEVQAIFSACQNLKHLAMLQLLFFGCLRASELCNLDDLDLDLKGLSVRVREGKGGRDGITYISEECAGTLRRYLEIRPQLLIEGRQPLFYTDFGNRWCRNDLHRMFIRIKRQAGITKRGGVHCFSRHTPATIMVSRGCDLRIIKEVLRHKDIRTTLKYVHVNDKVAHEWYNKTLRLDAKSLAWN
jgi:integrase/recombinase XerD